MHAILFWSLPSVIALAIYWPGLFAWFQQDDFAWLGLLRDVREGNSLVDALFHPSQHGTWRPLGERAFFLFFPWLFGYESWPMRGAAFLTQAGSLLLCQSIVLRLTSSRLAAIAAPILWIANSKMTIAMISNGAYIHILCSFFLLLALDAFLRGRTPLMWTAFLLGFGAMETNLVFPALATAYALLMDKTRLKRTLLLWPVSIAYYAAHMVLAPKMTQGSYHMYFDASIFGTFATYWTSVFQPDNLTAFTAIPMSIASVLGVLITIILLFTLVQSTRRGNLVPLLFLVWFLCLLAPVLPLREHVTGYYLTIPLAAFSMLAAFAISQAPRVAGPILAAYLVLNIPTAYLGARWWQQRSLVAERLVRKVFAVHQLHPGKKILLESVTDEQFWSAIAHYPFVENKETYVFLDASSLASLGGHAESGVQMKEFFLSEEELVKLELAGRILRLPAR